MVFPREYDIDFDDDAKSFSEFPAEGEKEDLARKKHIRKLLEKKLERKRLQEDIDELDGDFDWDELDR